MSPQVLALLNIFTYLVPRYQVLLLSHTYRARKNYWKPPKDQALLTQLVCPGLHRCQKGAWIPVYWNADTMGGDLLAMGLALATRRHSPRRRHLH